MTETKVAMVVLSLVAILFVVLVLAGNSSGNTAAQSSSDPQAYSSLASMNTVLAPFTPKVDVTQLRPAIASFDLATAGAFTITIAPDSSHPMRSAKFDISPTQGTPCAHLVYNSFGQAPPHMEGLKHQDPETASKPPSNPFEVPFVVLAAGGAVSISRAPGQPRHCTVTLN